MPFMARTWSGSVRVSLDKDNRAEIHLNNVKVFVDSGQGVLVLDARGRPTIEEVDPSINVILGFLKVKFKGEGFRFPQREWDALVAKLMRKKMLSEM